MRCNVCYLPIHDEKIKILCPRCTNSFHYDHLAAWLLNENKCPVCREVLSDAFREDLRPKTEKEKRRLEQILYTLDGLGEVLGEWETSRKQKKRLKELRKIDTEEDPAPSITRLIVPIVLFIVWIFALIILFG